MKVAEEVQTVGSAIAWIRGAWTSLPVPPVKLHVRDIEDQSALGSHRFSGPMWRIITGHPTDEYDVTESVMCGHPRNKSESTFDCPDCQGNGHYEHRVRRYRSPMAAALYRLSKAPAPSIGTPAPIAYIIALYLSDWDLWKAAEMLHLEPVSNDHEKTIEAMFTLAIRQLHSRYSAGPVARIGWTSLSESQKNAEDAA